MAAESILTYKKPGFPKTENSERSFRTTIDYVGPLSTIAAAEPDVGDAWGDYAGVVVSSYLSPLDGTDQTELLVVCEVSFDGTTGTGTAGEVAYEVEWSMFQRSLYEHPVFRLGGAGTYVLTAVDYAAIEAWKQEVSAEAKETFFYQRIDKDGTETYVELSANAKKFAGAVLIGIESYEDFAPVIRKTTTYVGGLPGTSLAGLKGSDPTFDGKPTGYEWRKSADRAIRAGGQTRWDRVEEWTGAIKVLVDRSDIFF